MLLRKRFIHRLGGGRLEQLASGLVSRLQLLFLRTHKDPEVVRLISGDS